MPLYRRTSLGRWINPHHGGVAATSQTFTVGRVELAQFTVPETCVVDGLAYTVGATAAGNVIGGIVGPIALTADIADGAPVIAQSASTAQGAINTPQVLTWTPVTLAPGIYYACLEGGDVTGTYFRQSNGQQAPGWSAQYDRAGGFGALTDPTPAVTATGSAIPGLRIRVAA